MKKLKSELILSFSIILLCLYSKHYLSALIMMVNSILILKELRYNKLYDILIKLRMSNQLYTYKEDKLRLVLGPSENDFITRCQLLKSQAKRPLEASFFNELSLTNNKSQIETLISFYLDRLEQSEMILTFQFLYIALILNLLTLVNPTLFQPLNEVILVTSSLILVFNNFFKKLPGTLERRIYLTFYHRLAYLSPMVSLKETLDELKVNDSIYNRIYEDVIQDQLPVIPKRKGNFYSSIYKICVNNKWSKEKILEDTYQEYLEDGFIFFKYLKYLYLPLCFLLMILVVLK